MCLPLPRSFDRLYSFCLAFPVAVLCFLPSLARHKARFDRKPSSQARPMRRGFCTDCTFSFDGCSVIKYTNDRVRSLLVSSLSHPYDGRREESTKQRSHHAIPQDGLVSWLNTIFCCLFAVRFASLPKKTCSRGRCRKRESSNP